MEACPQHQYLHQGRCCLRCPAGSYKSQHCLSSDRTSCLPCRPGEYMDSVNYMSNCLSCSKCEAGSNLETVRPCNRTHNTECRCQNGHVCHSLRQGRCERCRRVRQCGPGEGVTVAATQFSDTSCGPCSSGTFSNVTDAWSPCLNHTVCSRTGRLTLRPGDPRTDTSCTLPSTSGLEWIWIAGVGVVLLLLGVLSVWRRRRGWRERTENHSTQQMDQLLQFRMVKVVTEPLQDVVEWAVDVGRGPRSDWAPGPQDVRHLKGLSVDNLLPSGRPPSRYIEVVKGSSRSLPQDLVYENVGRPALSACNGAAPRPQPRTSGPQGPDGDGLEADHPGVGDRGVLSATTGSLARDPVLTDGAARPLTSSAGSGATVHPGPPTLSASAVFGRGEGGGPSALQPEEDEWME